MFFSWLGLLVGFGMVAGFGHIPALFWFLLVPMAIQDGFDGYELPKLIRRAGR